MKFVEQVTKEKFDGFNKKNSKSHFMQSYAWGEFAKAEKNLFPHYVGLENDKNELVATALLLEKRLPFHYTYFYVPRGFTIDYDNLELVKEFTTEIKKYIKNYRAIFLKIDPDIIYRNVSYDGKVIVENNDKMISELKDIGYKHLGFTKNFETMQPRYTFRIDMNQTLEEIEDHFSKTTKQRIKKADDFFVDVKIGNNNDIKTFYDLMIITENRKDFITHNEKYYQSLYKIWNEDNKCYLFLGSVNLDKIINEKTNLIDDIKNELNNLPKDNLSKKENVKKQELEKRLDKLNSDLSRYINLRTEYDNNITLSGHFIITYGDKAWVLYSGNHNILTDTYTNYKTYYEHIKYCYQNGIKVYDQFGTIGDLRSDNPLLGLHEFKKKFGGNYIEFTGEFDFVMKPFMYFVFTKLVPIYRNLVKNISKKKRKKHQG